MWLYSLDISIIMETHLSGQNLVWARRRFLASWDFYAIES